jgi:hypothetical protein
LYFAEQIAITTDIRVVLHHREQQSYHHALKSFWRYAIATSDEEHKMILIPWVL